MKICDVVFSLFFLVVFFLVAFFLWAGKVVDHYVGSLLCTCASLGIPQWKVLVSKGNNLKKGDLYSWDKRCITEGN